MWSYIIEVQICWLLLLGFYMASLRRETYFFANRWYLLTTLALGMLIPFVKFSQYGLDLAAERLIYQLPEFEVGQGASVFTIGEMGANSSFDFWWYVYWAGAGFMMVRLFLGLNKIWYWVQSGMLKPMRSHVLVLLPITHAPFSFFQYLFLSQDDYDHLPKSELKQLLAHEMVHIQRWHSLDRILLEVLCVFFWFSPLVWMYKSAIKDVHEYEADAVARRMSDLPSYGHLLMKYIHFTPALQLGNSFVNSQLKRRFVMMKRRPSNQISLVKYLLVVPLLLLALFVLSCKDNMLDLKEEDKVQDAIFNPSNEVVDNPQEYDRWGVPLHQKDSTLFLGGEDDVYIRVDEMPYFGEKESNDLVAYLSTRLKYPVEARESTIEGIVMAQFIVQTNGTLSDFEIIRSLSKETDEEVLRLLKSMPTWTPGKLNGKPVPVKMGLPVRFKLD